MEKVETITRHKSGNPMLENNKITWIEFVAEIQPQTEDELHMYAIRLLNGQFLICDNGYTYFLTGIKLRDGL